jgi:NADH:ubiquinone oxidoreductase subunit 6 (subunit J)
MRNFWNKFTLLNKVLISAAALFLVCGYLLPLFGIYAFPESIYVGYTLIDVFLISLLYDYSKVQKAEGRKPIAEYVGIIGVVLTSMLFVWFFTTYPRQSFEQRLIKNIQKNYEVTSAVGEIKSVKFYPIGSFNFNFNMQWTIDAADMVLLVKGSKGNYICRAKLKRDANTGEDNLRLRAWSILEF